MKSQRYVLYLCVPAAVRVSSVFKCVIDDVWFTLVVFDVSITGLSPPTSTLLFDLHQSGPDHAAFVYFQRHFPFLFVALTRAQPLSPSLTLSLCAGLNIFCSGTTCVSGTKCKWCSTSVHLHFGLKLFFIFIFFRRICFLLHLSKNISPAPDSLVHFRH